MQLDQQTIDALAVYADEMRSKARSFYDSRFQPKKEIKMEWVASYGGFQPVTSVFQPYQDRILGNPDRIAEALAAHHYNRVMPYNQTSDSFSLSFIIADKSDHWALLQVPKNAVLQQRDRVPTVLQSVQLMEGEKYSPEVLPLTPKINLQGPTAKATIEARRAANLIEKQFTGAGLYVKAMNDMGVLPNGQIVFTNPDFSRRMDRTQTPQQIQQQLADFQEALVDSQPRLGRLFDYIRSDGKWSQYAYFPPVYA